MLSCWVDLLDPQRKPWKCRLFIDGRVAELVWPLKNLLASYLGLIWCAQAFVGTRSSLLLHIQLAATTHSQEAVVALPSGSLLSRHVLGNELPTSIVSLTGDEPGTLYSTM